MVLLPSRRLLLAPRFSPRSIGGLVVWLKAMNILGVADAGAVATWPDASGKGNNVTQATEANKPLFQQAIVAGKPIVRFDGTNDALTATFAFLPSFSIFIVAKPSTVANNYYNVVTRGGVFVNATNFAIGYRNTLADASKHVHSFMRNAATLLGSEAEVTGNVNTTLAFHVIGVTFDTPSLQHILTWDGNVLFTRTETLAPTDGSQTLRVGEPSVQAGSDFRFAGDTPEIIIYSRALTNQERNKVIRYLGREYAIGVVT